MISNAGAGADPDGDVAAPLFAAARRTTMG
jgi:hypothetical protein